MEVWERFLLTVSRVLQLDELGAVERSWSQEPGERLYDELVLAGVRLTYDEDLRWQTGYADCFDLLVDAASGRVVAISGEAPSQQQLLDPETTEAVLAWYGTQVNDC